MNGETNENVILRENELGNPPIQNIVSLIENSIRDCHNKYFHTFDHICEYDLISQFLFKSMGMYELNKKLTLARENGYIFNHINILTIKIYSNLSYINIHYHLRLGAPPLHRHFFRILLKNRDYIQTHCNDRRNTFHFACRQWYSYNNPGILA